MRRTGLMVALCAAAALAADPEGTVPLELVQGKTAPIEGAPGTNIVCDDLSVVGPEFADDGTTLLLRARAPGSTLCGVWLGQQQPRGLYRVTVKPAPPPDAGASRGREHASPAGETDGAGSPDAGAPDAGSAPDGGSAAENARHRRDGGAR